jgi:hypothetical protein
VKAAYHVARLPVCEAALASFIWLRSRAHGLVGPSGFAADANRKSMKKQAVGIGPMQENRHSQSKHLAPIRVYQLN